MQTKCWCQIQAKKSKERLSASMFLGIERLLHPHDEVHPNDEASVYKTKAKQNNTPHSIEICHTISMFPFAPVVSRTTHPPILLLPSQLWSPIQKQPDFPEVLESPKYGTDAFSKRKGVSLTCLLHALSWFAFLCTERVCRRCVSNYTAHGTILTLTYLSLSFSNQNHPSVRSSLKYSCIAGM